MGLLNNAIIKRLRNSIPFLNDFSKMLTKRLRKSNGKLVDMPFQLPGNKEKSE